MFVSSITSLKAQLLNKNIVIYHNYVKATLLSTQFTADKECSSSVKETVKVVDISTDLTHFETNSFGYHYKITLERTDKSKFILYCYYFTEIETA